MFRIDIIKSLAIVLVAFQVSQLSAQDIRVVTPAVYENSEGPGLSGTWPAGARVQIIHSQSAFSALPEGGAELTALSFRPNGEVPIGTEAGWGQMEIWVSVTDVAPTGISSKFENNITGTPFLVYDGEWSSTVTNVDPPGPDTRPFDWSIPLQFPFPYDPTDGNLLVDWRMEDPASSMSASNARFDNGSRSNTDHRGKWTGNLGIDSPVADGGTFENIRELTFTVPEPSGVTLSAVGLLGGLAFRRKRSSTRSATVGDQLEQSR